MNEYLFTFPKTTLQSAKDLLELHKPWLGIAKSLNNQIPKETLSNMLKFKTDFQKYPILETFAIQQKSKIFSEIYSLSFIRFNETLNNIVDAYNTSTGNEFEIIIENIPVVILKSNLQDYTSTFKNLKIPNVVAVKLSIVSYFILKFAPLIYVLPSIIPFMEFLIKIFIIYGKPYIKELSKLQNPEIFAEKLADNTFSILFGVVLGIIGTLFTNNLKKLTYPK